jgi:hypothetical protein
MSLCRKCFHKRFDELINKDKTGWSDIKTDFCTDCGGAI